MTTLVNVFLRGAADGLSLLAPVDDPVYRAARPTLALRDAETLEAGLDGLRLHPAAQRIAELARDGKVAFVPAAGFPGQTRSHFQSQALLESAVGPDGSRAEGGTGWLGALLARRAEPAVRPFRGVAVGAVSVPPSLWGTADALGAPDLASLHLGALQPAKRLRGGYRVLDSPLIPDIGLLTQRWGDAQGAPQASVAGCDAAEAVLGRIADASLTEADPSPFGDGESAAAFAAASSLLDADLGTELVQVDLGGWDTHHDQGVTGGHFAELVKGLDAGIGAIAERHLGRGSGLVITVMTEFGRRVAENASGGTDHGRGGLALVIGDGVAGGLRGRWPGVEELDEGDVVAANDLRVVQSEVASKVFGVSLAAPSGTAPLGLFAA